MTDSCFLDFSETTAEQASLPIWDLSLIERLVQMVRLLGCLRVEIRRFDFELLSPEIQSKLGNEGVELLDPKKPTSPARIPANLLCSLRFMEAWLCGQDNSYFQRRCRSLAEIEDSKKLLFRDSKKASNGWVALKLNGRISIPISRALARFNLKPNWITLLNLPFILAAPYYYAKPGYAWGVLGGFLFQMASVLDGCDGEVARTKLQASRLGGWLDTFADNLSYLLFFIAVGLYPALQRSSPVYIYLMLGSLSFLIVALAATYAGMRRMGSSSHQDYRAVFQKMARDSSLLRTVDKLNFLSRRENFALGIFLLCLFDGRMIIYWLLLGALMLFSIVVLATFPKIYNLGASSCRESSSSTPRPVPKNASEPSPRLST